MQENCENSATAELAAATEDENSNNENFNVNTIKQTVTSVAIDWNLIAYADVYKIEKYSKANGWEKVAWTSDNVATIEKLEENFAYRCRIKALKYDEDLKVYADFKISEEFLAKTLSAPPSTLSLHRAIKKGQQFLVKRILRQRASLIQYPGPNGYLPLANAIVAGDSYIIDVLLTAGASIHIGNPRNRRTPLHLAFYHGRLPVARILLNKKAKLEACDTNGMTPSHFAVDNNQYELLRFALENDADLEAMDGCGWTLLMRAVVMRADVAILKLLLTHGADLNAVDKLSQTCVDLARLYGNEEAKKYFEKFLKKLEKNLV